MIRASRWLGVVLLVGCTEPGTNRPKPPDSTAPTPDSGTLVDTSHTGAPTDTAPTDPSPVFDCSGIPMMPVSTRVVPNARGYHDVAFDGEYLVGSDTNVMLEVDQYGEFQVWSTSVGMSHQFDWLPDGHLAMANADDNSLEKIAPDGSVTTIASDLGAIYGVRVGPDGMIYVANQGTVLRLDPTTGERETLLDGGGAKVLAFNHGYTRLYFGELGNRVRWVDLDAELNPVGPPHLLAAGIGGWHDGLGVDVCGNVYVADYDTATLYRITPDGSAVHAIARPDDWKNYGHGLRWGNGQGGWSSTALYQPLPYNDNTVIELEIGVPMANAFPGEVVGTVPF